MSVEQLKNEIKEKLAVLNSQTDRHDKMQIAINLKIALNTVVRYMDGEVRRLELAEQIIEEAQKVLKTKQAA